MKDFFKHTITLNVLFCISYYLLATLGFQWGALTSNATLLWPPSGLAVFGCIVFGRRILPGLLLGAIISSQTISLSNPLGNSFFSYLIATINGAAGILQALMIAKFSRTYYQRDFRVSTPAAFYFTLMVLASCSIAATIGNLCLWQADIITLTLAVQNWAVWWMGDTIGVLIISPLLFWLHRQKSLYDNSQTNAFFIFCAGIGVVLLTVAAIGHNDRETYRKNLIHETENLQVGIQANIDLATRDLSTLQDYFLKNSPSEEEFRKLTEPLLKRNLWLDSFSWTPALDNRNKKQLELDFAASLKLVHDDEKNIIWQKSDKNTFPNDFLTHLGNTLSASHSDIFLHKHIDKEIPIINLVAPIYFCNEHKKHDCRIADVVSSELNLDALMRSAISRNPLKDLNILLVVTNTHNEISYWKWLGDHWNKTGTQDKSLLNASTKINGEIPSIDFMGSQWQLLVSQKNISTWFLPNLLQCIILIIGFVVVC